MTTFDINHVQESEPYEPLPSGMYRMRIREAKFEQDRMFPNPDGTYLERLVLCWEVSDLTPEQLAASAQPGTRVYQRINAFWGTKRNGGDSKLLAFAKSLIAQGLIPPQFEISKLVGVEQRVMVQRYVKEKGVNAGQEGNKVLAIEPLMLIVQAPAATPPPSPPVSASQPPVAEAPAPAQTDAKASRYAQELEDLQNDAERLIRELDGYAELPREPNVPEHLDQLSQDAWKTLVRAWRRYVDNLEDMKESGDLPY